MEKYKLFEKKVVKTHFFNSFTLICKSIDDVNTNRYENGISDIIVLFLSFLRCFSLALSKNQQIVCVLSLVWNVIKFSRVDFLQL